MGCWRLLEIKEKKINEVLIMAFSTKEKLAIREAIHAMKWLDKHHDGWGLEEECAILENICSNCDEKKIQSNHNYLDLQYQINGAESEIERLRDEIKILKLGEKAATDIICSKDTRIKELEDDLVDKRTKTIMLIKKLQSVANDPNWKNKGLLHDYDYYIDEANKQIFGDNNEQCTNLDHDCVFQNLNESDAIAIAGAHGKDHYHAEQKVAFCIRNFKGCRRHKCWQITEGADGNRR